MNDIHILLQSVLTFLNTSIRSTSDLIPFFINEYSVHKIRSDSSACCMLLRPQPTFRPTFPYLWWFRLLRVLYLLSFKHFFLSSNSSFTLVLLKTNPILDYFYLVVFQWFFCSRWRNSYYKTTPPSGTVPWPHEERVSVFVFYSILL